MVTNEKNEMTETEAKCKHGRDPATCIYCYYLSDDCYWLWRQGGLGPPEKMDRRGLPELPT
jgi:hypothetical protein